MPHSGNRRSIRLPRYDYGKPADYFVTVNIQGGRNVLGDVRGDHVVLTNPGTMVRAGWDDLGREFPDIVIDESVVMPNHVHGIVGLRAGSDGPPLGEVVRRFKSRTTLAFIKGVRTRGWPRFHGRLWQRNYWERVIRCEEELFETREYIKSNPLRWTLRREDPSRTFRTPWE